MTDQEWLLFWALVAGVSTLLALVGAAGQTEDTNKAMRDHIAPWD